MDFQGSRVTSDGGLVLVRELDERLGLGELIAEHLSDSRHGKNTQLALADLFRQSVYSRVAGYGDVNDAELLTRPVGRPSYKPVVWYKGLLYHATSWKTARRLVAKVESHFGELFPRVGFIVTNLQSDNRAVVRFYDKRGTAEPWIKEGKQAVKMTRLRCHRFRSKDAACRFWSLGAGRSLRLGGKVTANDEKMRACDSKSSEWNVY